MASVGGSAQTLCGIKEAFLGLACESGSATAAPSSWQVTLLLACNCPG